MGPRAKSEYLIEEIVKCYYWLLTVLSKCSIVKENQKGYFSPAPPPCSEEKRKKAMEKLIGSGNIMEKQVRFKNFLLFGAEDEEGQS